MADAELEPKLYLNNKFISNVSFTDNMIEKSDPEQTIFSPNQGTFISRQQIVNHLRSDKFEFRRSLKDNCQSTNVNHENTYVSISESIYQSLDKIDLKKGILPCPLLVCNLLASHADTFRFYSRFYFKINNHHCRHGAFTECQDCIDFAESLHDALPFLDPVIFKNFHKQKRFMVSIFHTNIYKF